MTDEEYLLKDECSCDLYGYCSGNSCNKYNNCQMRQTNLKEECKMSKNVKEVKNVKETKVVGKSQKKQKSTKEELVIMIAFSGMIIGEFKVVKKTDKKITVALVKGTMDFDAKTGKQLNAPQARYANRIKVA